MRDQLLDATTPTYEHADTFGHCSCEFAVSKDLHDIAVHLRVVEFCAQHSF